MVKLHCEADVFFLRRKLINFFGHKEIHKMRDVSFFREYLLLSMGFDLGVGGGKLTIHDKLEIKPDTR